MIDEEERPFWIGQNAMAHRKIGHNRKITDFDLLEAGIRLREISILSFNKNLLKMINQLINIILHRNSRVDSLTLYFIYSTIISRFNVFVRL